MATLANDVLRWVRRVFDYAIRRPVVRFNPAAAFDLSDAGDKEVARDRALSRDERKTLFEAIRTARGFSVENALAVKLHLLLAVRKRELIAARWDEFELHFTTHDFRRTARTHLAALGVDPHVAERCLNHKLKGVPHRGIATGGFSPRGLQAQLPRQRAFGSPLADRWTTPK